MVIEEVEEGRRGGESDSLHYRVFASPPWRDAAARLLVAALHAVRAAARLVVPHVVRQRVVARGLDVLVERIRIPTYRQQKINWSRHVCGCVCTGGGGAARLVRGGSAHSGRRSPSAS